MAGHQANHQHLKLIGFSPKRFFHAYCLIGKADDWPGAVDTIARVMTIHLLDRYIIFSPEKPIGIDQIRKIESFIKLQPVGGRLKLIAFNVAKLSVEAEHALLKSVEEPLGHTIIVLCVESLDSLLPTLRSRCQVIRMSTKQSSEDMQVVHGRDILPLSTCRTWSLVERFRFVETIAKKGENIIEMLDFWLENLYGTNKLDEQSAVILRHLLDARKQLMANVQPRLVLEYIMLII